jgi:hypothetical protein
MLKRFVKGHRTLQPQGNPKKRIIVLIRKIYQGNNIEFVVEQ